MESDQVQSSFASSSSEWSCNLLAPLDGPVLAIETVPDPVFAQKLVGPGVAIDPTGDTIKAPCAGKIVQLHRAHHALSIEHACGAQVLLHIGLDTVKLAGEGFFPLVKLGDFVQAGQHLIRFDADLISRKARSLISVMVVTDTSEDRLQFPCSGEVQKAIAGVDILIRLRSKQATAKNSQPVSIGHARSPIVVIQNLPTGLHARPAAQLAAMAKSYVSAISVHKDSRSANAKSVVSIMALEVSLNDQIHFEATGADAEEAVGALHQFLGGLHEQAPTQAPQAAPSLKPSLSKTSPRRSDSKVLSGIGVSPGMAIGRIHLVQAEHFQIPEQANTSPEKEEATLQRAIATSTGDLRKMMSQVHAKTDAAIFSAHLELLDEIGRAHV